MWRATVADPAVWFTDEELGRSRRYQRPLARMRLARSSLGAGVLAFIAFFGLAGWLTDTLGATEWVGALVIIIVAVQAAALIYDPVLDWWVDMIHDKRWGISNQTARGFFADQAKSLVVVLVATIGIALPLYALVRATDQWWLWGWALVSTLLVAIGFVFPVVVAPIFNHFTPLGPGPLADRIRELARAGRVDIEGAFVIDASRRSTRDNAYVSGLGRTRRVVLYDTILEHPIEVVAQVVAHELGHWRLGHLRRQIPLLSALSLFVFVWLRALAEWDGLWAWAGAEGIGDPRGLPVVLLAAQPALGAVGMIASWVSRAFERQADEWALELLEDPETMLDMQRRLHTKNLADIDPGLWTRLRASHPPAAERMAFTHRWADGHGHGRGSGVLADNGMER